jgi:hypothetical protein
MTCRTQILLTTDKLPEMTLSLDGGQTGGACFTGFLSVKQKARRERSIRHPATTRNKSYLAFVREYEAASSSSGKEETERKTYCVAASISRKTD